MSRFETRRNNINIHRREIFFVGLSGIAVGEILGECQVHDFRERADANDEQAHVSVHIYRVNFVEYQLHSSYILVVLCVAEPRAKMRLSMVVELLLILLLIAFAAYGRVIGNDFQQFPHC